ncbi:nijmegen breakage syndrome 1 protein-like [Dioscorea cayenensis subsp. rotundata]|uniref:Nijmegen breakage syndrome 1 protein-like n=1 Tax=Dioscorea cayennensis subsp. rotundata TaxID=55577 RepID=A0AB40C741_DIOCR|nr:nijmegen breakage syndrome 1 protein-like [Dioscorea cayenensis subsp. rotundata]
MVWGLFPSESLRGTQKYYIFSKGSYKVGRRECDITVQTDTAVSRLHAEIIFDEVDQSCVRVVDRSKFGTWINKELGAKAVRLRENQEAMINDGDLVSFGTGNATFRFCFISFLFYIHGFESDGVNRSLEATISSIGGSAAYNWNALCTHAVVERTSPRPIVLCDWLQVLREKSIRTEVPSCASYTATLVLEGTPVKIAESKTRDKCLEGYTFILGSSCNKYKFWDKLETLLEVVGARFLSVDEFCSDSQTSTDGENCHFVLVIPEEARNEFNHHKQLTSLSRVSDVKLVAAILSGRLEPSNIEPASIVVSSSHSTDDTIVADSDVEIDTAASDHVDNSSKLEDVMKHECEGEDFVGPPYEKSAREHEIQDVVRFPDKYSSRAHEVEDVIRSPDKISATENKGTDENAVNYNISKDKTGISSSRGAGTILLKKKDKIDASVTDEFRNSDIIYNPDLIVRNIMAPVQLNSNSKNVVNFKNFRKKDIVSGNSFRDLIPFSKDYYKEGDDRTTDYMREERKRKQMEAIAEDLFNNEKARKRAGPGTSLGPCLLADDIELLLFCFALKFIRKING